MSLLGEEPDTSLRSRPIELGIEAIVIIDLVESTATSNKYGWYSVGRVLIEDLLHLIIQAGSNRDLKCVKDTGDGYLTTYADSSAADVAAVNATDMCLDLLELVKQRNGSLPEEMWINIRAAVHFGEVEILDQDRKGPYVTFAFRLETVNQGSLVEAVNPIKVEEFPLRNYVLCSENVEAILSERNHASERKSCGLFKLKGFSGYHEVFLVSRTT